MRIILVKLNMHASSTNLYISKQTHFVFSIFVWHTKFLKVNIFWLTKKQ